MGLDIILWGVAGYIAFFIFQITQPTRQRTGWDFFLQVAVFSLLCFVFARTLIGLVSFIFPNLDRLGNWWHQRFHYYFHSLTLIIGILIIAPLFGVSLSFPCIKNRLHKALSRIAEISGKRRNFEFTDLFFAYSHKLLRKLVMITLKSSKVYVGILVAATEDPNETQRYIQITPVTSGYREKETHRLILTTNYIEDIKQPDVSPNRDILIPVAEIVTLTQFDSKLHARFVSLGLTEVRDAPMTLAD